VPWLKAQNKPGEIAAYEKKYLLSFSNTDQMLPGSVYLK
jgi:hypothetical protein